jgi:hypothetical protein
MSVTIRPKILVIDDEPDSQRGLSLLGMAAEFSVLHPEEVDREALNTADLVLIDYVLHHWPARSTLPQIGLQPENGIALAAVLREHANKLALPTGFAIHTGRPQELWLTPAESRLHLIARAYNLEWVFLKSDPRDVVRQSTILAAAIRSLPASWPGDDYAKAIENVQGLLGLKPQPGGQIAPSWVGTALADVENCRPPVTELSERNHGLVFLRWLLQRILPYPCFLLDTYRLAARLRISHDSLQRALKQGLGEFLRPCRYCGALAEFLGERWWRAGIENIIWDLTEGESVPPARLRDKLSQVASEKLTPSTNESPIVCVDENYRTLPEAFPADVVVRIQPDDWPLYGNQAWTTVELARQHPRLRAVVAVEDRERVMAKGDADPNSAGGGE